MARTATRDQISADRALQIWSEYQRTGDIKLRNQLTLYFAPMVKYIVGRKMREIPAHNKTEDFISVGLEELIRAFDRYDPAKGASLERFLWTRIHGAVLDELRRNDWAPRSLRRWNRDMESAQSDLLRLYGRPATRPELADALGISERELARRLDEIAMGDALSLEAVVYQHDGVPVRREDTLESDDRDLDPERCAMRSAAHDRLRDELGRLSERELKTLICLHVHELKLREVGEILGVSESRVSQIHSEVLRKLRRRLESAEDLFGYALAA